MLNLIRNESVRKVQLDLPMEIRIKLARPTHPRVVFDFLGTTEFEILGSAISTIAYIEDCQCDIRWIEAMNGQGRNGDGNWVEFVTWTGLNDDDMDVIRQLMVKHGWKIGDTKF